MTSRISSTPGALSNAATQCSTRVLPASLSSCLGIAAPNLLPTPPPSTTATVRVTITSGLYRRVSLLRYPRFRLSREYPGETSCLAGRETMRMTAEELTANRRAAGPVVRLAIACRIRPVAMAAISVGFALIAAVWLSLGTARADGIALVAAIIVFIGGDVARVLAGPVPGRAPSDGRGPVPIVEWGLAACGVLAEVAIYAGIPAAVGLHPAVASQTGAIGQALSSTFVARLGGAGVTGVWRLAIIAVIVAVLLPVVDAGLRGVSGEGTRPRFLGRPGDARLPFAVGAVLLAGTRAALLVAVVLGVAALGATVIDAAMRSPARVADSSHGGQPPIPPG